MAEGQASMSEQQHYERLEDLPSLDFILYEACEGRISRDKSEAISFLIFAWMSEFRRLSGKPA
jgi:hypothetical protein